MRVAITRSAGFLGSRLDEKLRDRGSTQILVPRSRECHLRHVDAIQRMLEDCPPDILIHLAARVGGIGANRAHPAEFFNDNLMTSIPLLHEAWLYAVEKFVAIGTVCAYPNFTRVPFKEENLWDGYPEETNAPYGLAKKMLLVQSQTYRQQYGFNSIFLLHTNLYGPRDSSDLETSHVIPALIRKCVEATEQRKEEIVVRGDGSPTRDFLYVEDEAEGILLATERHNTSEPINLGSGFEISIKDLVELIATYTGFQGHIVWDTSKPNDQPPRALDTNRAGVEFAFVAKTPFEVGLRRTIDWFMANRVQTGQGVIVAEAVE